MIKELLLIISEGKFPMMGFLEKRKDSRNL
jgi:hypothetical protein